MIAQMLEALGDDDDIGVPGTPYLTAWANSGVPGTPYLTAWANSGKSGRELALRLMASGRRAWSHWL